MSRVLDYKLDLLKLEIQTINSAIIEKDQMCRQIKQWAVTLWVAAVGFAGVRHIDQPSLSSSLWAASTGLIPIFLCILDLYTKRLQRKYVWRSRLIHRFLNDVDYSLKRALTDGDIKEFRIYDPSGAFWLEDLSSTQNQDFANYISVVKLLRNPRIFLLYLSLTISSALLVILPWLVFLLSTTVLSTG